MENAEIRRVQNPAMTGTLDIVNPYQGINWATATHHRAGLHIHSMRSDGWDPPQTEVLQHYNNGYDVMALTDHEIVNNPDMTQSPPGGKAHGQDWGYRFNHEGAFSGIAVGAFWGRFRWQERFNGIPGTTAANLLASIRNGTFRGPFRAWDQLTQATQDRVFPFLMERRGGNLAQTQEMLGRHQWFSFQGDDTLMVHDHFRDGQFHRDTIRNELGLPARQERGMVIIPWTREDSWHHHSNAFWAPFAVRSFNFHPGPIGNTEPEVFRRTEMMGGITMINHPGRHTRTPGNEGISSDTEAGNRGVRGATGGTAGAAASNNPNMVARYVGWAKTFRSIFGMEIINRMDNETRSDRILWDNILSETMPVGRPLWGTSCDDAHGKVQSGFSFTMLVMSTLNEQNVRNAMVNGHMYAVTRVDRRLGLRPNAGAHGGWGESQAWRNQPIPILLSATSNANSIEIRTSNCDEVLWVTGNPDRIRGNDQVGGGIVVQRTTGTRHTDGSFTHTFSISAANSDARHTWGNYVRAVLLSDTAISYTQPFGIYPRATGIPQYRFPTLDASMGVLPPNNFNGIAIPNTEAQLGEHVTFDNGTPLQEILDALPITGWVESERGWGWNVRVNWDTNALRTQYNPASGGMQRFRITGSFQLPSEFTNTRNLPLTMTISVSVMPNRMVDSTTQNISQISCNVQVAGASNEGEFRIRMAAQSATRDWIDLHSTIPARNGNHNVSWSPPADTIGLIVIGEVTHIPGSNAVLTLENITVNGTEMELIPSPRTLHPGSSTGSARRITQRWSLRDNENVASNHDMTRRLIFDRDTGRPAEDGLRGVVIFQHVEWYNPQPQLPVVNSVSRNPTTLQSGGGNSTITVQGANLVPGQMRVAAFLNNSGGPLYTRTPTGSATSVNTQLTFPANTGTGNRNYTIRVSLNGGNTWPTTPVASVIVNAAQAPPPPTLTLNPTSTTVNDSNLTRTITVGGTATGNITIGRGTLPAAIQVTASGNTITVTGTRPAAGQNAISGTHSVTISRGGVSTPLSITVNLTPAGATLDLNVTSTTINDNNLSRTITASGTATGNITFNRGTLPPAVQLSVSGNTITVTGIRPAAGHPAVTGVHQVTVNRGGASRALSITVNLSALPHTVCPDCGQHPCVCDIRLTCTICGHDPCICSNVSVCAVCGRHPCICTGRCPDDNCNAILPPRPPEDERPDDEILLVDELVLEHVLTQFRRQMAARLNPIANVVLDYLHANPNSVTTNDVNASGPLNIHWANRNPQPAQRFTATRMCRCRHGKDFDACCMSCNCTITVDITSQVLYVNGTTGERFLFNPIQNRWTPA